MSFKIQMTSPDLQKQLDLMRYYPEVMEKHFRKVLAKDVAILYSKIKGTIPQRTQGGGTAKSKFRKSLRGRGVNMEGRVGWWGAGMPWYINIVEYGAKEHTIVPKRKKALSWGGNFAKRVNHPGFSARGFMAAGYSAMKPVIENDMRLASEAVLREMEVK